MPDEIDADPECPTKGLTVYIDREAGVAYDVMLNQVTLNTHLLELA